MNPSIVGNLILFQVGWFACVMAAAGARPWIGIAVAAAVAGWHVARTPRPGPELGMIAIVAVIGLVFDSMLAASGWLSYASPPAVAFVAPAWIVALWVCFATTLNVGLRWLHRRPLAAAALGGIGGPLAYLGGEALGGVTLTPPAVAALAAGWALVMPVLVNIAVRMDGWQSLARRGAAAAS